MNNETRKDKGKKPWGQDQIDRQRIREQKKEQFEKAIEDGWLYYLDVATKLGISPSAVLRRAKRLGITFTKLSNGKAGKNSWKPYCSPSDFERIKNYAQENKVMPAGSRRTGGRKITNYKTAEYRIKNKEYRKRYYKNPIARVRRSVSVSVWGSLVKSKGRGKGGSVFEKLGYSPRQLKEYIESQFDDKMSWNNYGTYWHIDHIIPQAALPYISLDDENFRIVWNLSNLRPLAAKENASKGSLWNGIRYSYDISHNTRKNWEI
jgi:AraC-like DNA-binding protein